MHTTCIPDISLVNSHSKADGGYNDWHLSIHPLLLDGCPLSRLQTWTGTM